MVGKFTLPPFQTVSPLLIALLKQQQERIRMSKKRYLTQDEVADRYRGLISVRTLCNWRSLKIGPAYCKIGKTVLYDEAELDAWDERNTVKCAPSVRE